jgi:hypothetical protein
MKYLVLQLISVIIVLELIQSCSSVVPCIPEKNQGNPGSLFNSENEEYSPIYFNEKLYFTSLNKDNKNDGRILISDYLDGKFEPPRADFSLPLNSYPNSGLPRFYSKNTKETELFFAAMNVDADKLNSDIYHSVNNGDIWSKPIPISKNINTIGYESYPAISSDGSFLIFVSDRKDGNGGTDLYISIRNDDGNWSEPQNLGDKINSSGDETSPFIANDFSLYYSSKGKGGLGGFDIFRAVWDGKGWTNPIAFKEPINSPENETGACIVYDKIVLASDRRGGCGGKDIYIFTLCGPVIYEGKVISESGKYPLNGTVRLLDERRNEISKLVVDNSGNFKFNLNPSTKYIVQYYNSCILNYVPEQEINSPCSDSSSVKITSSFILPEKLTEFDFAKYKVPFFVTGYYQPNTVENLQALRLKFSYNIFGQKENTKYIENPGQVYDQYSTVVEEALNESALYIVNMLANLKDDCLNKSPKLLIKVTGYADPRQISPVAAFEDESIDDESYGVNIERGTIIDNLILSKLRAYYTAKFLQNYLKNNTNFSDYKDHIEWQIEGKGIDDTEMENELKRRVNIEIGMGK